MVPDLEAGSIRSRIRSLRPRRISRPVVFFGLFTVLYISYYHSPKRITQYIPKPISPHTKPNNNYPQDTFDDDLYFDDPLEYSNNDNIPPMNPSAHDLPDPSRYFTEVDTSAPIVSPRSNPFPDDHLPWIQSTPVEEIEGLEPDVGAEPLWVEGAFAKTWEAPEGDEWRGSEGPKRVQFDFDSAVPESDNERRKREDRREAVKRGFIWAWQGYKKHAWGHDEVKPVSQAPSDPFNNWGASIIDSLDTLLLMGLSDEYNQARPHINKVNFQWISGHDYINGFVSPSTPPPSHDSSRFHTPKPQATRWTQHRDRSVALPVFETGIRYLGGFLGAYDLTGDQLLLDRAVELAAILGKAFLTPPGLPLGHIEPGSPHKLFGIGRISLAEVGSMSLELTRLSQVTGDRQWFDLAQRATDFLDKKVSPRSSIIPLIPTMFDPSSHDLMVGTYSFGGLADSYYEYLIKEYRLLGGNGPIAQQYKKLYERSIDAASEFLYVDVTVVPDRDLMTIGKQEYGHWIPECEHLTCFAGAMLGLGAKLLDRPQDMVDAKRFTQTCYWLSAATASGLQPESVTFFDNDDPHAWRNVTLNGELFISPKAPPPSRGPIAWVKRQFAPPPVIEDGEFDDDVELVFRDRHGVLRDAETGQHWVPQMGDPHDHLHGHDYHAAQEAGAQGGHNWEDEIDFMEVLTGEPPGTRAVSTRGLSRPETIESIYYMYRLSGNKKWQDKGWKMFTAWSDAAKVAGGFSSVDNVVHPKPEHGDNLESFVFAETFKYHYLLQSEPDYMSLDNYVANTEAHWLIADQSIKPGSQGLWIPPDSDQDLGERGQGTDAQKWVRFEWLEMMQSRRIPVTQLVKGESVGSGPGMGFKARHASSPSL